MAAQTAYRAGGARLAGTYELFVCNGPCDPQDPSRVIARGRLVLEDAPHPLTEPALGYFRRNALLLLVHDDEIVDPNACFVLERPPGADTYAGIDPVGMTRWKADSTGAVVVRFYQSPDAGYVATLRIDGDSLLGRGVSWGVGDAAVDFPDDSIRGRRIGPPDRGICIRAAEEKATTLRHPPPLPAPHPTARGRETTP